MLFITVTNDKQNQQLEHEHGPLEFGRGVQRVHPRLVVEDVHVSRDQLRVEELPDGRVRLDNLSTKIAVSLPDGTQVPMGGSREFTLPVRVFAGQTWFEIAGPPNERLGPETLLTIAQPVRSDGGESSIRSLGELGDSPSPEKLTQWMEAVVALQRSAAGPAEFFDQTVRTLIRMVGLDVALVLLRRPSSWEVVARAARDDDVAPTRSGREFSQTLLNHVYVERRTFYQDLGALKAQESLRHIDSVVASPIFGVHDEVLGVLYGVRRAKSRTKLTGIRPLEAQVVQLLAAAIGTNVARAEAARTRVQFEQFFSSELVRELERSPDLLEGRNQEVTILMSDLRGFSTLSERLSPQDTCELVRDMMERLSARIVEHGGAIVSYLGDGILAMWNAPARQEDHAVRACRAALAMVGELPALNARWQEVAGQPLALGIGINTGPAQVGNTGSSRKFMYGPLGNTVNVASRVEGATKQLGISVLVTTSTRALLGDAFALRRLGRVRVVGIAGPIELFELAGTMPTPEWAAWRDTYEKALATYESGQWFSACQTLLHLLEMAPKDKYDTPTLKLMRRAWACLESPPEPFDPVLELASK
jgi:adenylate cyclase